MTRAKSTVIFLAVIAAACWLLWTGFRNQSAFVMAMSIIPLYFAWKASGGAYDEITAPVEEKKE